MNKCPHIQLTQEIIDYVLDYATDENLLRTGGLPNDILDKAAFGFSENSVKTLMPEQLKIRWHEDLENVKWEIEQQGIEEEIWAQYIDLTEPIEVELLKSDEFEEGLYISDGHHRYYAAKILGKPLNVKLEIKANPIEKLAPGIGYDNFHRCLFKQVKEEYGYKEISRNFLTQFSKNVTDRVARDFIKGWIEREGGDKVLLSKKEYFIFQGIKRTGKVPRTSTNENVRKIVREVLKESSEELEFRDEHIGHNSGQEDMELGLYINDEIIGMVQYTLYDGELTVRDVLVRPEYRRKGYGSRMMQYIKKAHPEYEYIPSMMTDLGAKFKHKEMIDESTETSFNAFHGSESAIDTFEDSFLAGENVTQHHGAGIYFTTNYDNARMFGDNVYKVVLKGRFLDRETSNESVSLEEIVALMKMSDEEWEMEAYNYNEDPETGVMIAAQSAIDYAENEVDVFLRVQSSWYQYAPLDYVRNMTKLGYDGMIVDAPRDWVGEKHIIVFNPAIITFKEKID